MALRQIARPNRLRLPFFVRRGAGVVLRQAHLARSADLVAALLVALLVSGAIYFGQGQGGADGKPPFANPLRPAQLYAFTYGVTALYLALMMRALPRLMTGLAPFMLALAAIHFLWLPFVTAQGIERMFVLRMNTILMALCFQVILTLLTDLTPVLRAIRAIVALTAGLNMLVVLRPDIFGVSMGVYLGRAAGLYEDPNICATFMALLVPLAAFGKTLRGRCLYYALGFVAAFFTFSRSGILLCCLAVTLDMLIRPGGPRPVLSAGARGLVWMVLALLVVTAITLMWTDLVEALAPSLTPDTMARLRGADEGSGAERVTVLQMGLQMFVAHPVFGGGFGATRDWLVSVSVHNMIVLFAAEFGIFGLLWSLVFLWRLHLFPAGFGAIVGPLMTVQALFTHSYFDLAYYMMVVLVYWRLANMVRAAQPIGRRRS